MNMQSRIGRMTCIHLGVIALVLTSAVSSPAMAGAPSGQPVITGAPITTVIPAQNGSVIINLRQQGVVSGSAPLGITGARALLDFGQGLQATQQIAVGVFNPRDTNTSLCLEIFNNTYNPATQQALAVDLSIGNLQTQATAGPTQVAITQQTGLLVNPQDPTQVAACYEQVQAPVPPVANAGPDQSVIDTNGAGGELVSLNGSASTDSDGTIVSYVWSNAAGAQIATGATPAGVALPDGVNTITLTVTDSSQLTATDTVVITVGAPRTPVANAGPDQNITDTDGRPGELVSLNGSASADPDGTISSYVWRVGQTQIATGVQPTGIALPDGQNVVTLTITDNSGLTATDTVVVNINAAPTRTVLGDLPGLTPNQKAMADGLDALCNRVLGEETAPPNNDGKTRASSNAKVRSQATAQDRADLATKCNGLLTNNTAQKQINALDQLSGNDFAAVRTQTLLFSTFQYVGIMDRLMALRGGARGLSLAGLNINLEGKTVPLAQLERMAKQVLGGGAGADEPGSLLSDKWGLWVRGNYSFGGKDRTASSPKFDADQFALLAGLDYRFSDNFVLGGALSYGDSSIDFQPSGEGKLDTTTWALSMYGETYAAKNFYFDALLNVANGSYKAHRNITYTDGMGLVSADAQGDTDGLTLSGALTSGYDFVVGGLTISPNIGAYYVDTTVDDFIESGAGGLNLAYDKQKYKSFTGNLGVRATFAWNLSWGVLLPHLRTDYVREFHNNVEVFGVHFDADPSSTSPPILIRTENPDQSYWRLAAGFAAQFKGGISGYIDYQRLQSYESISFQDVSVGLRFQRSF